MPIKKPMKKESIKNIETSKKKEMKHSNAKKDKKMAKKDCM